MPAPHTDMVGKKVNRVAEVQTGQRTHERKNIGGLRLWSGRKVGTPAGRYQVTYHEITLPLQKTKTPTETLFPILLLESVVNFSGRDVFSNEEFDHNALFHAPR